MTEDKIVAFKLTNDEFDMLEGLAKMLYERKTLPKPTVNALAKSFTFTLTNQFIAMQNQAGAAAPIQ
jgi:hypothetical protein